MNENIRVTDALDIAFDPVFFYKTREGILVKSDRVCRFYAMTNGPIFKWSDVKLTLELNRYNKITQVNDVIYVPGSLHYVQVTLQKGDLLNFYHTYPSFTLNTVYDTVVQISWLYSLNQ